MKIRIKIKNKKPASKPAPLNHTIQEAKNQFTEIQAHSDSRAWLRQKFIQTFQEPPTNSSPELMRIKLSYHFFKESCTKEEWSAKSEKTKNRYKAAMTMDVEAFDEDLKADIKTKIKEESQMAKTSEKRAEVAKKNGKGIIGRKVAGKTLGLGVHETWAHVFSKMTKKTDEELVEFLKKEFPGRSTFNFLTRARREYNLGKFTEKKPAIQAVEYLPKGSKPETTKEKPKPKLKSKVKVKVVVK